MTVAETVIYSDLTTLQKRGEGASIEVNFKIILSM